MLKALKTNRLVNNGAYGKILLQYNEKLKRDGKVNNKKFYEEIVVKEIPSYGMQSWYQFLKRFKTEAGIIAVDKTYYPKSLDGKGSVTEISSEVATTLLSNQAATASFIQSALNIGAARAKEIQLHPELMTAKEAMDFAIKAMKAQDSRIHAIGKVREDNREEEKLNRAFSDASYAN